LNGFSILHSTFCIFLNRRLSMYGNGRPTISNKQLVRVALALTILAWATQVLFKQWGYGAEAATNVPAELAPEPRADAPAAGPRDLPAEHFISPRPMAGPNAVAVIIELRSEATITGPELRLKQIARWSSRDGEFFRTAGELVLARLDGRSPYRVIEIAEIRRAMSDAGVNMARVRFSGPMSCTINRSDTKPDPDAALAKFIAAKELPAAETFQAAPLPTAKALQSPATLPAAADSTGVRALRELLVEDLSIRLHVPLDQLQVAFNPKDDRVLNFCEPQFKFNLDAQRVRDLGQVSWNVTVVANGGQQKMEIAATARAWQSQLVVNHPITTRAVIRNEDVVEKRTLVDRLPDEAVLTAAQCIGQQAARDLRPGTVLTARMVEAIPLARNGQLITVTLNQGNIRVKSVARALEGGSFGQRIRVRNDTTNDIYDVVLTGQQEATLGDNK
jgi:flagella basal body P-ring formation protein FlgA